MKSKDYEEKTSREDRLAYKAVSGRDPSCSRNHRMSNSSCLPDNSGLVLFLILLSVLPSMAKGPDGTHFNRVAGQGGDILSGANIFRQKNHSDITAQAGATAALPCRLSSSLADGMVSWVRRRDYHLLTVGRQVYSSDARVGVKVSPDGCDWTLTVRWVATHDTGLYECQVSSHPPQALRINLSVDVILDIIYCGSEDSSTINGGTCGGNKYDVILDSILLWM
ncbi:uncharacterized protein [Palaemon carinicauda]|uniref:uncharacterized protein n=1 Tax=Palaemon carinicauda TaxID=392227 RepID=UPI0035B5BBDE